MTHRQRTKAISLSIFYCATIAIFVAQNPLWENNFRLPFFGEDPSFCYAVSKIIYRAWIPLHRN